ncbi:hypothetical protein BUALT_Bualt15G0006500 [Buddleja alternifolia]|uniref:Major facilitator superfamily (MFS) profile domain-containing protein n=1 Tax=Buddleja alternifolia TaxID=168488 RepID=A0AAV6WDB1_9LAMI|nr:hypothetical protein BUALT_Bualt15G0006500 [Buddleja alternifolia]
MVVIAGLAGLMVLVEANIPSWLMEAVVTCICMYMVAFPWSWGALGWFYPSEIFPLEVRSAAQNVTVAVNMLVAFIMGQFFLTMFCSMKFGVFIFFAFFLVMIITYCYFLMPERKNISVEEMTQADQFIIFASDGLWEHLTNQEVVDIVQNHPRNASWSYRHRFQHEMTNGRYTGSMRTSSAHTNISAKGGGVTIPPNFLVPCGLTEPIAA